MSAGADLAISSYLWLKNDLIMLLAGQHSAHRLWPAARTLQVLADAVTVLASITENVGFLEIGTGAIKLPILG